MALPIFHSWASMKTSSAAEPARKGAAAGNSRKSGFAKEKARVPVEKINPEKPGWLL